MLFQLHTFTIHHSISLLQCRYIVCKNLLPKSEAVTFYLRAVNEHLDELSGSDSDVIEVIIVDSSCIYMYTSDQ